MARTGGVVNYNTFVQGLVTEASPLTFPENATLREENFELRRDGTRARRYGMDYESGYDSTNLLRSIDSVNGSALMSYEWFNAGNSENKNFLLVQIGHILYIYDMEEEVLSTNLRSTSINLDSYRINDFLKPRAYPVQVAALKGYLIITNPVIEPIYISYDDESNAFAVSKITVQTRDLFGIADETKAVDHRPTSLSSKHEYNLKNQGWTADNITLTFTDLSVYPSNADIMHLAKSTTYDSGAGPGYGITDIGSYKPEYLEREIFGNTPAPKGHFVYNVFNRTFEDTSAGTQVAISSMTYDEPNDTLTVECVGAHGLTINDECSFKDIEIKLTYTRGDWEGRTETTTYTVRDENNTLNDRFFKVTAVPTSTSFKVTWYADTDESNYNSLLGGVYIRGTPTFTFTTTNSQIIVPSASITSLNVEEPSRFKTCAGYAGRAWYAGMDGGSYGSYIFYSQILDTVSKIGECYQEADPTSEHISDLVDTDGGFIVVPEARNIQKLVPMGQYLFIFSTNGVWRVFGDDGGNFRATAYSVEKVSDVGLYSPHSVVSVEGEIYYWAKGGIYKIDQEQVSGSFQATNLSQLTIQKLFFEIPAPNRKYVKGSYDPTEKKIYWMYSTQEIEPATTPYKYDSSLIFDIILGAFYKYIYPVSEDDNYPFIAGIFNTPEVRILEDVRNVVYGYGTVSSGSVITPTANVVSTVAPPRDSTTQTKYLVFAKNSATHYYVVFAEHNNTDFLDWYDWDVTGIDAPGYMITGSDTQGSQANKKQAHYLLMYFNRTEQTLVDDGFGNISADNPSSCQVTALWDWATNIESVRAGSTFEAYRLPRYYISGTGPDPYTYGEDIIVTKSKLRGRGRALSIAIQTSPGYDLHVLGWSMLMSGGRRP